MTGEPNDHPTPWIIAGENHESDGAAYVAIYDANGNGVLAANSWWLFDRGEPYDATPRDWAIARKVVEAVNAPAAQQWIPVAERLPTTKGPHLVFCGLDCDDTPIYFIAAWDAVNGVWRMDEGELIMTVTHWQAITTPKETS